MILENDANPTFLVLKQLLKKSELVRLIDGDDNSDSEILDKKNRGIKVLSKRHIESYLWDDSILERLCTVNNQEDKLQDVLNLKNQKLGSSILRGNPSDDIKSASADLYSQIKKALGLTKCGNNKDAFLRDTIAPLITEETSIYQLLEKEILQ